MVDRRVVPGALIVAALCASGAHGMDDITGRYVGSFHHTEGPTEGSRTIHRYDMTTKSVVPGGYDLKLRFSLNYQARPGEEGSSLLRSRIFGDLRNTIWQLKTQFVPWQDVSPGEGSARERIVRLGLNLTPRNAPQVELDFNRQNRVTPLGTSQSEDLRAELSHSVGAVGSNLSYRRIETESLGELVNRRKTQEFRGGTRFTKNSRHASTRLSYEAHYTTLDFNQRQRTLYTQSGEVVQSFRPTSFVAMGGSAYVRWGKNDDTTSLAVLDIDERTYNAFLNLKPWSALDLHAARNRRERRGVDEDVVSDYIRFQATLRSQIYRRVSLQTGAIRVADLESAASSVPANSVFALLDGTVHRGIAGRMEVRASKTEGERTSGTQWRRLAQARTNPTPRSQITVTWREDRLPRVDLMGQVDRQWEFLIGYRPVPSANLTTAYRRLDGDGRVFRSERFGSLVSTWRLGRRTNLSANWSKRVAVVNQVRQTEVVVSSHLTLWLPGEYRTKASWQRISGDMRDTASTYSLAVDKTF